MSKQESLKTQEDSKKQQIGTQIRPWAERYFFLIVGLSIIFWALAFPLIKFSLNYLAPENLAITRLFIASLIFLFIFLFNKKDFSPLQKKDVPLLFILGFVGVSIYHLSLNYGEQFVSAGAASLIITTIPIFVVIFATIFLSERISKQALLGIIISFIGVVIISLYGNPNITIEIIYLSAAAAVLLSSIVGAMYTIMGKKLINRYTPLSLTAYAFLIGNTGLILFIRPQLFQELASLPIEGWIAVIFLACFPTVIAYTFWYAALEVKPASELTIYLYITPIISPLVSCLFFGESITMWYVIGGFLVLFGLYVVNRKKRNNSVKKTKTLKNPA